MTLRHPQQRHGFTLIEMMLVIAVVAVVMGGASMGIGAVTRSKIRSACMHVASSARFAYNRSISQGVNMRLLFDFEKGTLAIEQSEADVGLARESRQEIEDGEAVDPWAMAKSRLENPLEPVIEASSGFGPVVNDDGDTLKQYQAHSLGDGIRVHKLITPHEKDDRISGQGAIYFFKGGTTEHAVVQLTDSQDNVYSVELHPMTGRAKVHSFAYEPTRLRDEESEVRDNR